ncbi:DUF1971 domain-containing protein [Sphingomicrobium arenosum]|uniref:DUF1971 domain-containing protein n=1 Tax=Sphingomicrobium arenosum TaxID=2233861 RepID=UPI00224078EC|nr:DUF1971 domain-containing protein [Sphingomicrobium arenosum]
MTTNLPDGLEPYKRTATFTEDTLPAGLLAEHSTKDGVWGLIRVEEGALRFVVTDPRRAPAESLLTPEDEFGIIEPTILHRVESVGTVRFHVQFLRFASAKPPASTPDGSGS